MAARQVEPSHRFENDLKHLSKKHRDLQRAISEVLSDIAKAQTPPGDQIPGLNGAPVFKLRIKHGNTGKRGGARLIYYCAEALVIPLFVYAKNDLSDIPTTEILKALRDSSLLPPG